MNIDDKKLSNAAGRMNINIDELKKATNSGNIDDFIDKNLKASEAQKLKQVLSNKDATEKLLSTPQAKELLKKLMKS